MKTSSYVFVVALMCGAIALAGCRKEDATPVYNYIGGSQVPTGETDLTAGAEEGERRSLAYSKMDLSACDTSSFTYEGKGFASDQSSFETVWNDWCDKPTTFAAFDEAFIAYYSVKLPGCSELRLKSIAQEGTTIAIDIEKALPGSGCTCTKPNMIWRTMLAIEKVEGATPSFNETTVEAPCD